MSNDKEIIDFKLDELEKPLTEQEMKATTGGAGPSPGPGGAGPSPGQPPGLYVQVEIKVNNAGGSSNFATSQFGRYVPDKLPPVVILKNPSINFSPPPIFEQSFTPKPNPGGK